MELKLVYRFLRKVSDWTLEGFYSEVYVEGYENVSREDPLILTSTHHNEIIDIATLAATIPHRRHVSFWAKSSMFANPIAGSVLSSSGAIPVKRNPNHGSQAASPSPSSSQASMPARNGNTQAGLFLASSKALAKGDVIGVFPEGTSYTMPGIVQVMPGAAWAAVDYVKWARSGQDGDAKEKRSKELTIVPVGIVYTDKSQYLSRIVVRYGRPIVVSKFVDEANQATDDEDEASKAAARNIMAEVESQMKSMSINASNWDVLYAAQVARDILWGNPENIKLKDWVAVSQKLVSSFEDSSNDPISDPVIASLNKYHALLYYTGIQHTFLGAVHAAVTKEPLSYPRRAIQLLIHMPKILASIAGTVCFIPPMLIYRPAYMTGLVASKLLAGKGEEESPAQYKAIFGGAGIGLGYGLWIVLLQRAGWLGKLWPLVVKASTGVPTSDRFRKTASMIVGACSGLYFMIKWHNLLVLSNYKRLKRLLTFCKVFLGLKFCRPATPEELQSFIRSPPPPINPFIRKSVTNSQGSSASYDRSTAPKPRFGSLIRPLLDSRAEAVAALKEYLQKQEGRELQEFLRSKGAVIP